MLKEFIAQREWVIPLEPSLDIVTDTIEFAVEEIPRSHPISISGYHIRDAGSTAAQEAAFTLADGFAYVVDALDRGLDIDEFGPQLSYSSTPTTPSSRKSLNSARRGASTPV